MTWTQYQTHIVTIQSVACEQAPQGALVEGGEKEGELATMSLELEFHLQFPCGILSTGLSNFCQSVWSGNEHECKQTLKNMCQGKWCHYANQHFTSTFLMQTFKLQRLSCKLLFLSALPPEHPLEVAPGYIYSWLLCSLYSMTQNRLYLKPLPPSLPSVNLWLYLPSGGFLRTLDTQCV